MVDEAEEKAIRLVLLRCGRQIFPSEKDLTKLARMTAERIGVPLVGVKFTAAPRVAPMSETGPFFPCVECGEKRVIVEGICPGCKGSEGGKYLTKLTCLACGKVTLSHDRVVQWYKHFGYEFRSGLKKDLGIKTITDEGEK